MQRRPVPAPLRLLLVGATLAAVSAGCGTTTAVPRPFPVPGGPEARTPPAPTDQAGFNRREIALTALALMGTPYRLGGADPDGFDCSGLVQYVFARHGVTTPRIVEQQVQLGRRIEPDEIGPGDLVFFRIDSREPSHVGIAIDGRRFVHAPRTGRPVRVDTLDHPYWERRYAEARRMDPAPSGGAVLTLRDEAP